MDKVDQGRMLLNILLVVGSVLVAAAVGIYKMVSKGKLDDEPMVWSENEQKSEKCISNEDEWETKAFT